MSHSADLGQGRPPGPARPDAPAIRARRQLFGLPVVGAIARALSVVNRAISAVAAVALVLAALVLSYSVVVRYAFHSATYWQDEAAVFLIIGATFLSAAYVQERRGHVAIEALAEILPASVNRIRAVLVDVASCAFCGFFSWKSWTLFDEAWTDGQVTSSTWGPPLSVPYGMMAAGMTLLTVQIVLQIAGAIAGTETAPSAPLAREPAPVAQEAVG